MMFSGALIRWTVRSRAHSPRAPRRGRGVPRRPRPCARLPRLCAGARAGRRSAPRAGVGRARARGGDAGAGGLVSGAHRRSAALVASSEEVRLRAGVGGRSRSRRRCARRSRLREVVADPTSPRATREAAATDALRRSSDPDADDPLEDHTTSSRGGPSSARRAARATPRSIPSTPAVVAGRARASPDRPDASIPRRRSRARAGRRPLSRPPPPARDAEYALRRGRDRSASTVDRANALLETVARRFRGDPADGSPRLRGLASDGGGDGARRRESARRRVVADHPDATRRRSSGGDREAYLAETVASVDAALRTGRTRRRGGGARDVPDVHQPGRRPRGCLGVGVSGRGPVLLQPKTRAPPAVHALERRSVGRRRALPHLGALQVHARGSSTTRVPPGDCAGGRYAARAGFFGYFAALGRVMDADPSVYAVSSWNDNGQAEFVEDESRVYRSDFPGARVDAHAGLWRELRPKWRIRSGTTGCAWGKPEEAGRACGRRCAGRSTRGDRRQPRAALQAVPADDTTRGRL